MVPRLCPASTLATVEIWFPVPFSRHRQGAPVVQLVVVLVELTCFMKQILHFPHVLLPSNLVLATTLLSLPKTVR